MATSPGINYDPYSLARAGIQWENSPSLQTGDYTQFDYSVFNTQPTGAYENNAEYPEPIQITKEVFAPDVIDTGQAEGAPMDFTTVGDFGSSLGDLFSGLQTTSLPGSPSIGGPQDLINTIVGAALGQQQYPPTGGVVLRPVTITKNAYACGRGTHISKAKKGPRVGACVRNRHMNPLNPHALHRAVRRLSGFQHFAVKTEKAIRASFMKAGIHPTRRIGGGRCGTCRKTKCSC